MRARHRWLIVTALTLLAAACTDNEIRPFADAAFPDAAPESAAEAAVPDGAAGDTGAAGTAGNAGTAGAAGRVDASGGAAATGGADGATPDAAKDGSAGQHDASAD